MNFDLINGLRLNKVQLIKDHNSYELVDSPSKIAERIPFANVIELDLWKKVFTGDWHVSHNPRILGSTFGTYLGAIQKWHNLNPQHHFLIINIDVKIGLGIGLDTVKSIDKKIHEFFNNSELYRPKDLKGSKKNCREAANAGNWPIFSSLAGKIMFVITGGPVAKFPSKNSFQADYVKEMIIKNNYEGVAFVAPFIDDKDDIHPPSRRGDLDGINNEKEHVVMFNASWGNRGKFDTNSIKNQNLLLWFWGVPTDDQSFNAAVQKYQASVIGSTGKPEDIDASELIGERGRDVGNKEVTFYRDDNGWRFQNTGIELGIGEYSYHKNFPSGWNDEIRSVDIPSGLTVYMTDKDSFKTGGKGTVTIKGPRKANIKDVAANRGLAGKVSSIRITES